MIRIRNYYKLFNREEPNELVDISIVEADPTTEPLTLQQFKDWAKITSTDEDTIIGDLITAARQNIETYCGISITEKTIIIHSKNIDAGYELPYGPVKSITGAFDEEDEAITDYEFEGIDYSRFTTAHSFINLEYVTGYTTVPKDLILAIKKQALWDLEHRGDEATNDKNLCDEARKIANQYKRTTWLA